MENDEDSGLFDVSDSEIGGSLWVLLPRAALSVGLSMAFIVFVFWMEFGEISTFAYGFAGVVGLFQIVMIYGLRQYKKAMPIIADTPMEEPKRESTDE